MLVAEPMQNQKNITLFTLNLPYVLRPWTSHGAPAVADDGKFKVQTFL